MDIRTRTPRRRRRLALPLALTATALAAQAQTTPDALAAPAETIVVSATRHAMALIDAPASIAVITRQEIEARGADNVFDAVRGDLGLSVQSRTISGRKAINLRGMDSRHTLVLVDGKRISASDGVVGHSDYQYDWIIADDIERIEVIRGPMSVLYGAEALGGVVNVITRKPGDAWRFGLLAEGSHPDGGRSGNGNRATVSADGPLGGGVRLAISAADSRRAAVSNQADPRVSDLEGRHKRDADLRLYWTPAAGHELSAEHRVGNEERWAYAKEKSGARRYYRSDTPLDRTHDSLAWAYDGAGPLELHTLLRAYRSTLDVGNLRNNGVASLRPQSLKDEVVEGQASLIPLAGHVLGTGFELRREALRNDVMPGGEGHADHRALYLQDEATLAKGLALTAGVRWDDHSRYGTEWSPRAYLVWQAAPGWTVKGGYGHGFKAPTLKQILPDYKEDEGPYTYVGNAALKPETNDAVEASVGWDNGQAAVQGTLFRNRVKDLIVTRLIGVVAGRNTYVFENTDRATLQGLETAATWRAGAGFTLGANWQLLDATDAAGNRLEKRPRHMVGVRVDWAQGGTRAGVRAEHQRGLLMAAATVGQPSQPMPSTTMVSAQVAQALPHGLELSLGVDNLTNVDLASKSPLFVYAEAPRTWRLALRGRW